MAQGLEEAGPTPVQHQVGDLAEVLSNLGVFGMRPEDVLALCPSGFRRVPIHQGNDHYLSLQGFAPDQIAYAHTHPDSEEWVVVLRGSGRAFLAENPVSLEPGVIIGRAAARPHGFESAAEPMHLLSLQVPRPSEATTSWDQPGETTDPADCAVAGTCRRCPRCGGHSANVRARVFLCENCTFEL
ncbi:MAG TPA: cupin domain-containing protein [Actinomycetota bacterium]|nr:cupin domain-containing protein [Actinomycetota bacterium]